MILKRNEPATIEDFPNIMDGVAGEFAKLYSRYLEPPKEFFYMGFLSVLGSYLSDRLTLNSELLPQPRLYVVLLGESGDTRKSTAINKTVELFKGIRPQGILEPRICYGVGSAEGLQKFFQASQPSVQKVLLCLDEFKQLISKCRTQGSVLLPTINSLFESNQSENHTKNKSIKIQEGHLSILAASTLDTYQNTWSSAFTDIGFTNRLFIVPASGRRKHPIPNIIPEQDKKLIRSKITEMFDQFSQGRLKLEMSPDAKEMYDAWYNDWEWSVHNKRLDTYAMRLMPLLAVNEFRKEVDIEIAVKAIMLCDWEKQMRQLFDPIDADNEIAKMEEKIRRHLKTKGTLPERELKRAVHSERQGIWAFEKARDNLLRSKEIGKTRDGNYEYLDQS